MYIRGPIQLNFAELEEAVPIVVALEETRMGISRTTLKSRKRKFVPSSHPGPFAVVASSQKSLTKVATLACLNFL